MVVKVPRLIDIANHLKTTYLILDEIVRRELSDKQKLYRLKFVRIELEKIREEISILYANIKRAPKGSSVVPTLLSIKGEIGGLIIKSIKIERMKYPPGGVAFKTEVLDIYSRLREVESDMRSIVPPA